MSELNAETLAEWREDAEEFNHAQNLDSHSDRVLALLDALAAEKAAREEAERTRVEITRKLVNFAACKVWKGDVLVFDGVDRVALAAEVENGKRNAEARAVKAERERDEALAQRDEAFAPGGDLTLLNALQDAEEDRDAAERELSDLRARIEALADRWQSAVAKQPYASDGDVWRYHASDLRAALSPTDPTKEN